MRLAFLGNCQLTTVGSLFRTLIARADIQADVVWDQPVYDLTPANTYALFSALGRADVIYTIHHGERWGAFSTANLSKYFAMKIVPNMETTVSAPQLGYWSDKTPLPQYPNYVDFRFLELYLRNIDTASAAAIYRDVQINSAAVATTIDKSIEKYAAHYANKTALFDYAPFFRDIITRDAETFLTHNHPSNPHLQWLTNQIARDCGFSSGVDLTHFPEKLGFVSAPSFRGTGRTMHILASLPMETELAAKLYYFIFSTFDRAFLNDELRKSSYYTLCRSAAHDLGLMG